jgi:hypothetical protein
MDGLTNQAFPLDQKPEIQLSRLDFYIYRYWCVVEVGVGRGATWFLPSV